AVMGCVVNGPGESRHANIGISLPGTGEAPSAPVFEDGQKTVTLRGENIADEFVGLIDTYVERHYGGTRTAWDRVAGPQAAGRRVAEARGGAARGAPRHHRPAAPAWLATAAGVYRAAAAAVGVCRTGRRDP